MTSRAMFAERFEGNRKWPEKVVLEHGRADGAAAASIRDRGG
jgi:hypothetical protein